MQRKSEKYIGYWIHKVDKTVRIIYDQRFQDYGLSLSQEAVLHQLWDKDGITQKQIQDNLSLRGASVSGLVETLLKKGLVTRKQDEEDARCKRLYLTETGRALQEKALKILVGIEDEISEGLTDEEKAVFICWLKKLHCNLEKLEK